MQWHRSIRLAPDKPTLGHRSNWQPLCQLERAKLHRMNRGLGVGAMGCTRSGHVEKAQWHRMNRCIGVGAMGCIGAWPRGESLVGPNDPTGPSWSVGALTRVMIREHVKHTEVKPSTPDDPTRHRTNASVYPVTPTEDLTATSGAE